MTGWHGTLKASRRFGYRRELELFCQTDVHRPEVAFTPTDPNAIGAFTNAFGAGFDRKIA